ncbi:unnamed protein product, partial [Medioppia subpectinata]
VAMDGRMPLSVPKSSMNCSTAPSVTVTMASTGAQPRKKIFSGNSKQNRAVFNMKNFWSDSNGPKKSSLVSSKTKNSIFDVQYVWRPKAVSVDVTTADGNDRKSTSPLVSAAITHVTTTKTTTTYLTPTTTASAIKSPTKASAHTVRSKSSSPVKASLKASVDSSAFITAKPAVDYSTQTTYATRRMKARSGAQLLDPSSPPPPSAKTSPEVVKQTKPTVVEDNQLSVGSDSRAESPVEEMDAESVVSETSTNGPLTQSSESPASQKAPVIDLMPESSQPTDETDSLAVTTTTTETTDTTATSETTTQIISKPKRKIFSSANKKNRAVFSAKNFWTSGPSEFDGDDFGGEPNADPSAAATQSSSTTANANNKNKMADDFDAEDDYVVLRRVKKAHQCHDLGETEQFDDDIKYHLSGIDVSNSTAMRCLSILGLTQQAMRPEFRMHLRAHDDMPRIISALMDAPTDDNLALCTACLMFVYSQDRLTMDIDPNALSLMLQLLETRSDECNAVDLKTKNKVKDLCEQMKKKDIPVAKYLKLSDITAGTLAMETLLGLTSKRAGDWFKEELRRIKGIDFIMDTVLRCSEFNDDEGFMVKIDRCMHVLENVTLNNLENQEYILKYREGLFINTSIQLLHSCKYRILLSNDSKVFLSAFFSILRVLTHLTSESADGCLIIGSYEGIIDLLLESIVELPSFIMSDQRFDLMVILLCLCINLVEFCPQMRDLVVTSNSKLKNLIELLFKRIEEAVRTEQQTDELLESHEKVQMTEAMRDSLLHTMLSQSGNHMEHSIIAACIALLLGCTIQDNMRYTNTVRSNLPNQSFDPLVEVLQKLRDFAYLADIMTKKGKERVDRIIQVFKSS